MNIKSALFKCSSEKLSQCPSEGLPEFAFIGRSNVGKSSLINMMTSKSGLAKVSGTPGKTKLINHFLINDNWYLVDLPGYGYARASKSMKAAFSKLITSYITKREPMYLLFVLIDSRLEPQKIDMEFTEMLGENGVPFALIFTKSDKQSANKTQSNVAAFRREMLKTWDELPPIFVTSSQSKEGRDELLNYIGEQLEDIAQDIEE